MGAGVGSSAAEGLIVGAASVVLISILIAIFRGTKMLTKLARSLPKDIAAKSSARKLADSEAEERLYDLVRQEYESGDIRSGLWAKAEATALSTEEVAIRAKYFQLRFEQLQAHESLPQQEFKKAENTEPQKVEDSKPQVAAQSVPNVEKSIEIEDETSDSPTHNGALLGYIIGSILFAWLFTVGYQIWDVWPEQHLEEEQTRKGATELLGVELGMTPSDMLWLRGTPYMASGKPEWSDDWGGYFVFMYFEGDSEATYPDNEGVSVTLVGEAPNELMVTQICSDQPLVPVDGFGIFMDEEHVIERLGDPDHTTNSEDNLSKTIYYWDANLNFTIKEGEVAWVCVGEIFEGEE